MDAGAGFFAAAGLAVDLVDLVDFAAAGLAGFAAGLADFAGEDFSSLTPADLAIVCSLALRREAVFGFRRSFLTALSYSD